jgi:predicted transcriptional regulator
VTPRQKQTLDFIEAYERDHGYGPMHKEIAGHLGIGIVGVHYMIRRLAESGKIEHRRYSRRGVSVAGSREKRLAAALEQCATLAAQIDDPKARLIGMAASTALNLT